MRYIAMALLLAFSAKGDWFRNPMVFTPVNQGFELRENAGGFAVREDLPLSRIVTVEGTFEFKELPVADNWHVAGLSIMKDDKNFWHLAVVRAPDANKYKYSFELAEMLDGHWLSQTKLKLAQDQRSGNVNFTSGSRWNLKISMDEEGVTGEIKELSGKTVFLRRYLFSARAVTCGRPALHTTGLPGTFTDIKYAAQNPVQEKEQVESFPPYQSDNFVKQIKSEPTGFFYVKQFKDGRWWAIDPLGRGTVVLGVDHITYHGHWCSKLGYCPHLKKNKINYPDPAVWEEETLSRLKKWGFTMLGAGSQDSLSQRGLYHCYNLGMGQRFTNFGEEYHITPDEKRPCSAFPNVFHPDFKPYCRYLARLHCAPKASDPWIFGWFIDNELAWWGVENMKPDFLMRL